MVSTIYKNAACSLRIEKKPLVDSSLHLDKQIASNGYPNGFKEPIASCYLEDVNHLPLRTSLTPTGDETISTMPYTPVLYDSFNMRPYSSSQFLLTDTPLSNVRGINDTYYKDASNCASYNSLLLSVPQSGASPVIITNCNSNSFPRRMSSSAQLQTVDTVMECIPKSAKTKNRLNASNNKPFRLKSSLSVTVPAHDVLPRSSPGQIHNASLFHMRKTIDDHKTLPKSGSALEVVEHQALETEQFPKTLNPHDENTLMNGTRKMLGITSSEEKTVQPMKKKKKPSKISFGSKLRSLPSAVQSTPSTVYSAQSILKSISVATPVTLSIEDKHSSILLPEVVSSDDKKQTPLIHPLQQIKQGSNHIAMTTLVPIRHLNGLYTSKMHNVSNEASIVREASTPQFTMNEGNATRKEEIAPIISRGDTKISTTTSSGRLLQLGQRILSKKVVEREVVVPKKRLIEETIERLETREEVRRRSEIVNEVYKYKEKITEVQKPVIKEALIAVPEVQYVEKVVEVPVSSIQHTIVERPQLHVYERVIPVPKKIQQERIAEVIELEYRDVPVERIIEIPEIHEKITIVKKRVPQIERVVERRIPVPMKHVTEFDFDLPTVEPIYTVVDIPLYVPRFVEVACPIEALDDKSLAEIQAYADRVSALSLQSAMTLTKVEKLADDIRQLDPLTFIKRSKEEVGEKLWTSWKAGQAKIKNIQALKINVEPGYSTAGLLR